VGEIAAQFHVSRPAISHHLKVLKDAGMVISERTGQEIYYHLDRGRIIDGLRQIADAIESCCPPS
jgi:DNA-binding transcriptional ArsR family regulator